MISFGMVAIPVQLFAATEAHTVRLCVIDAADGSRVQHRRFCATWQLSPERSSTHLSL
jgi:DNA end-binding protein Ku